MQDENRGRPRIYTGPALQTVTTRLSLWHVRAARRLGKGNASEGIRLAIELADCGGDSIQKPTRSNHE